MPGKSDFLPKNRSGHDYLAGLPDRLLETDAPSPKRQAMKITAIYFLIGSLWILLSDNLLDFLIEEQSIILLISIIKGWIYVGLTSVLIYLLVFAAIKKVSVANQKIKTMNLALENQVIQLNNSNTLFSAIMESSPQVTIFALDSSYCYSAFNHHHQQAIAQIRAKEIRIGMSILEIIGGNEPAAAAKAIFDRALGGESFVLTENVYDQNQNRSVWQNYYAPIVAPEGQVIGLTCIALNISDQAQAEANLIENDHLLSISQKIAHIGSYVIDLGTKTWQGSPEINDIFGIDEVYPRTLASWVSFIHPDSRLKFAEYHNSVIRERKRFDHEFKIIRHNDGEERWVQGYGDFEHNNQNAVRVIGTIQDITKRKKADEEVLYLSYHDKLTGLYNRRFYEEEIIRMDQADNLPIAIIIGRCQRSEAGQRCFWT